MLINILDIEHFLDRFAELRTAHASCKHGLFVIRISSPDTNAFFKMGQHFGELGTRYVDTTERNCLLKIRNNKICQVILHGDI